MPTSPLSALLRPASLLLCLLALVSTGSVLAQAAPPPERLFETLEQAVAEMPKDSFDTEAALARIGTTDPAAIFEWVRDNTGFVAYRGALKGASGVLMDRQGNSLDRALLLERLLETAGHRTALARATLSGSTLEVAAAAQRVAPQPASPETPPEELGQRAAAELNIDQAVMLEELSAADQGAARFWSAVQAGSSEQGAALAAAVDAFPGGEAVRSGVGRAEDRNRLLSDHWWVQVELDGAWVDLDPTLSDARVGTPLTSAEARFDLPEVRFLAAVEGACPDLACGDRLHRVGVAAVAETWDGEQLSEQEIFSTELLTADASHQDITFAGLPEGWPELDPFGVTQPLAELREQLLATTSWQPTLFVAGASVATSKIGADGQVGGSSGGGNAGAVGGLGGGLGGMFGRSSGGAAGAADDDAGTFTALWLVYTVHTPGGDPVRERRQVFDLIGPAARAAGVTEVQLDDDLRLERALALGGETDIVISGSGLTHQALSYAAATRLLEDRAAWSQLYFEGRDLDIAEITERLDATASLYPPLELLQALRSERLAGYASGAFVAAFHRRFEADLTVSGSFDIVTGEVSSLPGTDLWFTRVVQGATDTVLEAEIGARSTAASGEPARRTTVADAYAADLAAGVEWRVVTDTDELAAVAPALPADLAARVAADMAKGRLAVLAPGGEGAVGWYSFDLHTGAVLGRGERGWGQAAAEYAEKLNIVLQVRTAVNQYAAMGRCLGLAVTGPLRGLEPEDADTELGKCVFTTICAGTHTAVTMRVALPVNWTNLIVQNTIDALWGGTPETGFGGMCGSLWNRLNS